MHPTLYTVAYPVCAAEDMLAIDTWRAANDPTGHALVRPHFTLVFASNAVDEATYLAHVAAVAARTAPIAFHCRYAMLGADAHSPRAHAYLVSDEGHAALSLLHDALYTGPLADALRLTAHVLREASFPQAEFELLQRELLTSLQAALQGIRSLVVDGVELAEKTR